MFCSVEVRSSRLHGPERFCIHDCRVEGFLHDNRLTRKPIRKRDRSYNGLLTKSMLKTWATQRLEYGVARQSASVEQLRIEQEM